MPQDPQIASLQRSVDRLRWTVATAFMLGLIGMISVYILLADRVDDSYAKTSGKLDAAVDQIAAVRVFVTRAAVANSQSETAKRAEAARAIRPGATTNRPVNPPHSMSH